MTVAPETIRAAILAVRDRMIGDGEYADARAINGGGCADFAQDVITHLGIPPDSDDPFEMGIDNLMTSADGGMHNGFDRDLIRRHWPSIVPPDGMDWDDVDTLAHARDFSAGTHVWVCGGGMHYDAETPTGVANPFDLPFFRRMVAEWLDDRPSPKP